MVWRGSKTICSSSDHEHASLGLKPDAQKCQPDSEPIQPVTEWLGNSPEFRGNGQGLQLKWCK